MDNFVASVEALQYTLSTEHKTNVYDTLSKCGSKA